MKENMFYGAADIIFERAAKLRANPTPMEEHLWHFLSKSQLGIRFKRQHPIGNYIADFYCHTLKLVIEIDGSIHNSYEQQLIDKEKDEFYQSVGITVLRITNKVLSRSTEEVLNNIKRMINSQNSSPSGAGEPVWQKKGVIYKPDGTLAHSRSHAQVPYAYKHKDFLRVYFSSRDDYGQSRPTFIDVDYDDPTKILYIHDTFVLDLGGPGEYDETGAMPSWFVPQANGDIWLYYTGWNRTHNSYRLSMGLSVSTDGGLTFKKMFRGPIMDRSIDNPLWAAQPSVMYVNGRWMMWYISGQKCEYIHGYPEPYYDCRVAVSEDGIRWTPTGDVALPFDDFLHAVGRPSVFFEDGIFKMYYSYRHTRDYRTDRNQSYRLGYAESKDGFKWERKDDLVGIHKSDNPNDFDYEMIDYAYCYEHNNKKYLLYNGNGFGRAGFGYAILEK